MPWRIQLAYPGREGEYITGWATIAPGTLDEASSKKRNQNRWNRQRRALPHLGFLEIVNHSNQDCAAKSAERHMPRPRYIGD